jgi:hypothetical protein
MDAVIHIHGRRKPRACVLQRLSELRTRPAQAAVQGHGASFLLRPNGADLGCTPTVVEVHRSDSPGGFVPGCELASVCSEVIDVMHSSFQCRAPRYLPISWLARIYENPSSSIICSSHSSFFFHSHQPPSSFQLSLCVCSTRTQHLHYV